MERLTRRGFIAGAGSVVTLTAACSNGVNANGTEIINQQVDSALNYMYAKVPSSTELAKKASGMLVMPLITKVGFGLGGSYGRGALRVGGVSVDYYSATSGSFGLQIGAQQYAYTLFFMTPEALAGFRNSSGWQAGAGIEYVANTSGGDISGDTTRATSPVVAVVYGQAGLIVGATIQGTKYNRIIP